MLSVITLASKKSTIMHYTTALNASKKENDTNCWFEFFYGWAVIVTLQSTKNTLLAWHYFWQEEIRSDTFWTDLIDGSTWIKKKQQSFYVTMSSNGRAEIYELVRY